MAPQAGAPGAPHRGDRPQRGIDRADDNTKRARAAGHCTPRRNGRSPLRKSGGRASFAHERGGTNESAPGALALRRRQWHRERRVTATASREEANAPTTTRREGEPPSTKHRAESCGPPPPKSGGRATRRRQCGGTTKPVPAAPAQRRRQLRCECRATPTTPREKAPAPTTTRIECEPPGTTHYAESLSRHRGRAAAKRHATASAAARPSQR